MQTGEKQQTNGKYTQVFKGSQISLPKETNKKKQTENTTLIHPLGAQDFKEKYQPNKHKK